MPDEPDPPRKIYQLGKAEFARVNPKPETPSVANIPAPDVHAILRDNLARAHAAGLNDLAPQQRRPSRRKRDYWTMLIGVNGLFCAPLAYLGPRSLPGICVIAAMIIFSVMLTWVMWLIMDNY